jgi:hypothetical protein
LGGASARRPQWRCAQNGKEKDRITGFEVIRLVNEPMAAALVYGLDRLGQELRIAVIDFGGGNLDVTIMEFGKGVFEVKGHEPGHTARGDGYNQLLFESLAERFSLATGVDVRRDRTASARLIDAAEVAKIEPTSSTTTHVSLPFLASVESEPKHLELDLTRAELERIVRPVIERCRLPWANTTRLHRFHHVRRFTKVFFNRGFCSRSRPNPNGLKTIGFCDSFATAKNRCSISAKQMPYSCGHSPTKCRVRGFKSRARNQQCRQISWSRRPSTWWRHEGRRDEKSGAERRLAGSHWPIGPSRSRNPVRKRTCAFCGPSMYRLRTALLTPTAHAAALSTGLSCRRRPAA